MEFWDSGWWNWDWNLVEIKGRNVSSEIRGVFRSVKLKKVHRSVRRDEMVRRISFLFFFFFSSLKGSFSKD